MRMPLTEFVASGDLKFMLSFLALTFAALYFFVKKIRLKDNYDMADIYKNKINGLASWILILAALSLLLGLMHSFYFIGKAGGIAPNLIFLGASNALITPVSGIGFYILCKLFNTEFKAAKNI